MRVPSPVHLGLFTVIALAGQDGPGARTLSFEIASIKQANLSDDVLSRLSGRGTCLLPAVERSGNRVRIPIAQFCGLIRVAYDVTAYQVVGVPAIASGYEAFYEIEARAEAGSEPTMDQVRTMLRNLLAERFGLRVHGEAREMRTYELTVAKGGIKKAKCSDPKAPSSYSPGLIRSCEPPIPLTRVSQFLSLETGRPVIDKTGLGAYEFELHWLPEDTQPAPDSPPSLFTALQEQLGLKLEAKRGFIDCIVVDRVERLVPN